MPTRPLTLATLLPCWLLLSSLGAAAEVVSGVLPRHWNEGAADCAHASQPPIEVHAYEPQTYILRESLCVHFEAPFIYLLVGSERALLIDTGAVAEPERMPLARTVMNLLPEVSGARMPLLVVHTHAHGDHHRGDAQFASLASVKVVAAELPAVKEFFDFKSWPGGFAHIDLGGRTVDVMPSPGHEAAHVVFYDSRTTLLLSGDFLLPGRLIVDDAATYLNSAVRVADYLKDRPVAHVLGAHIELDTAGKLLAGNEPLHHPNERSLELTKADLMALPATMEGFNGFYETHAHYVITNPLRNLIAVAVVGLALLSVLGWGVSRLVRWRRAAARARRG